MPVSDRSWPCTRRHLWLSLAALAWAWFVLTIPARACDGPPGALSDAAPERAFADADAVFRGTVLDFREPYVWREPFVEVPGAAIVDRLAGKLVSYRISARIEVEEAWKGVEVGQVRVWADTGWCGAGMQRLEPGDEVLIFAVADGSTLVTTVSTRPQPVDSAWARAALAWLGPGEVRLRSSLWQSATVLTPGQWIALVTVSLLVVLVLWRRRPQVGVPARKPLEPEHARRDV